MRRLWHTVSLVAVAFALTATAGCSAPGSNQQTPSAGVGETTSMKLESPAFDNGGPIPLKYANTGVPGGENISIPYSWADAPEGTKSFALLLVDTHPAARQWVHWMVVDIPADATSLPEGASLGPLPDGTRELPNSFGTLGYGGPQPPAGTSAHQYRATLYALDTAKLEIPEDPRLPDFMKAVSAHTLAEARWAGVFGG